MMRAEYPHMVAHRALGHLKKPIAIDGATVYLAPIARARLRRLDLRPRAEAWAAFLGVGEQLLQDAEQLVVQPAWLRRTWPRRRYPQQCYGRTVKFMHDHPDIVGLRLIHGVVSHRPRFVPFDHAWVELPGDVVFDAVVQRFFTRASYYAVMAPVALDAYSGEEVGKLVARHRHPGPWNVKWLANLNQFQAYAAAVGRPLQAASAHR
jgi:hypothetical protein